MPRHPVLIAWSAALLALALAAPASAVTDTATTDTAPKAFSKPLTNAVTKPATNASTNKAPAGKKKLKPGEYEEETWTYWRETMQFGTPTQKEEVLKTMAAVTNVRVVEILLKALEDETSDDLALKMVQQLADRKSPRAMPILLKRLATATGSDMLSASIGALGQLGDKAAAPHLYRFLTNEKTQVCQSAALALGQLKDTDAGPLLLALVDGEKTDNELRYTCVTALGQIKYGKAYDTLRSIVLNTAKPVFYRMIAITALGQLGDGRILPDLLALLKTEKNPKVQSRLVEALGLVGSRDAVQALVGALSEPGEVVRRAAVDALARLKDPRAVPALVYRFKYDQDKDVVLKAARALYDMGYDKLFDYLIPKFEGTREPAMLEAFVKLIRDGKCVKAIPALKKKQEEMKFSRVKESIAAALVALGEAGKADPKKDATGKEGKPDGKSDGKQTDGTNTDTRNGDGKRVYIK